MSRTHIKPYQQTQLAALLRAGVKQKDIAKLFNKHPSAISREISENRDADGIYRARSAQTKRQNKRIKANQRFRHLRANKKIKRYIEAQTKEILVSRTDSWAFEI